MEVRSRDAVGLLSAWSAPVCTTLPLDGGALTRSNGWSVVKGSAFYGGSVLRTTTKGATLTRKGAVVDRVGLLVSECPSCGSVSVSVNGHVIKTFSLVASRSRNQVVLMLPVSPLGTKAVVVRTLSGKQVSIDGLVLTRI